MKEINSRTDIFVLRHGECEGGQIFRGRNNVSLTRNGLESMHQSAGKIPNEWDVVISSPLRRCREFSEQFCEEKKIELQIDDRIQELSFGSWEGQLIEDIWKHDKERITLWSQNPEENTPPGGETLGDAHKRVEEFLLHVEKDVNGKKVLLVSHGGIIRLMLTSLLKAPLSSCHNFNVPFASVSHFAYFRADDHLKSQLIAHNFV